MLFRPQKPLTFSQKIIATKMLQRCAIKNHCCDDVKAAIIHRHKECNSTKAFGIVKGRKINCFFNTNALQEAKEYKSFLNIKDTFKTYYTP